MCLEIKYLPKLVSLPLVLISITLQDIAQGRPLPMQVLSSFSPDLWSVCGEQNPVKLDNSSAECQSTAG